MPAERSADSAAPPTVLLVDDDPLLRHSLRVILRQEPYLLREATGARQALEFLAENPCDLVVTDESMPGMTGTELSARLSASHPNLPRIVFTGEATLDLAVDAINRGQVFRFLQKPCKPTVFKAALREGLQERRRLLALAEDAARSQETGIGAPAGEASAPEAWVRAFGPPALEMTAREREISGHLVTGWRLAQIAQTLCLSEHTVRNHLKSVFQKLDVHSQAELIERARMAPLPARDWSAIRGDRSAPMDISAGLQDALDPARAADAVGHSRSRPER